MSIIAPESDSTEQRLRDEVTSAYRPESLAALRQLAGTGANALVITHLVKRFEKSGGLMAGLKQHLRRNATPDLAIPAAKAQIQSLLTQLGNKTGLPLHKWQKDEHQC